jgi:raffinose/stachyose/melibiose transport system permease protein
MYKVLRASSLTIYAAIVLIPCMIVITGAFKTDFEIYTKPLSLPAVWSFANFRKLFVESNIATPFMNSVIVSAFSVIFTLLFARLSAY